MRHAGIHMASLEQQDLVHQLQSLEASEASSEAIENAITFLKSLKCDRGRLQSCHSALCQAMLAELKNGSIEAGQLLNLYSPGQTLMIVFSNIACTELPAAVWLSQEVQALISSGRLTSLLTAELGSSPLTPEQDQLVGYLCRLPDSLANRLGRQIPSSLLPPQYFKSMGESIADCLKNISAKSASESVVFLAAVIGKACVLGQRESILLPVLSLLESHVTQDAVWRRVSQALFSHVPLAGLEGVLEYLVQSTSPCLSPSLLRALLGDIILNNQKAKFILTHKLVLVRVLSSPNAVYNLIGYLWSCDPALLGKSLELALGVWSDGSALRHMTSRQHLWISSLLVLGVNCLKQSKTTVDELKSKLQRLTMAGIEAHIQSPLEGVRQVGMAVGEVLMNTLCPTDDDKRLQFEYQPNSEVQALLRLSRPLDEIRRDLEVLQRKVTVEAAPCMRSEARDGGGACDGGGGGDGGGERFGEGMAKTTVCSDSDSDDDLPPYSMTDDPDSSVPRPPQYLRTLMQGLLASKDPQKMESSLKVAENMIRSEPSDLSEVCVELAKILLHLSDVYALPGFTNTRHSSLVALAVTRPRLVAPYLTREFYAPHYNLRQRMDVLEIVASAALELSQPRPSSDQTRGRGNSTQETLRKPWEKVIEERLKAKTRVISKGHSKASPTAVPSRFADVAPLFFFPLMTSYDRPQGTLDLLGQDSLVLGNLLYTLGTVMYAANHSPLAPAMGVALLDFTWALRYHSAVYVRQGVLYSLAMLLSATPPFNLVSEMEGAVGEAIQWAMGVASDDADSQCRVLARHALAIFDSIMKEVADAR